MRVGVRSGRPAGRLSGEHYLEFCFGSAHYRSPSYFAWRSVVTGNTMDDVRAKLKAYRRSRGKDHATTDEQ